MQELELKVLIVGQEDYEGVLYSIWGLPKDVVQKAELIIDKDSGKILKSRYF